MPQRPLGDVVDEMGRLQRTMAAAEATKKRYEKLRQHLLSRLPAMLADETRQFAGAEYVASVGARSTLRTIRDLKKLARAVGPQFWEHAGFPLAQLDALMTAEARAKHVTVSRGGRTVKIYPLIAEEAEGKAA